MFQVSVKKIGFFLDFDLKFVTDLKRIASVSHESTACLSNVSVSITLLPSLSSNYAISVLVGVSACHVTFQDASKIACVALLSGSDRSSLSIFWQDGQREIFPANITCQCNAYIISIPT